MALERMMDPPMLDTTGQDIVTKLDQIKDAVQPTNTCLDIDISIPANGWSNNSPYTYTYTNAHISYGCSVKVDFLEGAQDTKVLYLEYEKVVNGVRFTSATKPTTAIPVRLHVLNADATSAMATTADEVSTSAVSGSANVEDALGSLSEHIAKYAEVKFAFPTAANSETHLVLPEGFTTNKTVIVGCGAVLNGYNITMSDIMNRGYGFYIQSGYLYINAGADAAAGLFGADCRFVLANVE